MSPDMAEIRMAYRRVINSTQKEEMSRDPVTGKMRPYQPDGNYKNYNTGTTGIPEYQGSGTSEVLRPGDDGWPAKGPKVPTKVLEARPGHLPPGTMFANSGGSVPGVGSTDSIPAMLTPGEYVINANAAAKNSALLSAINNGTAQGFNAGGPVKYMYTGGMTSSGGSLALDTREFKDATNVLSSSFGSFSQVANSISDALSSFSIGTITHEHTHTFTGSVNFDIVGSDIADELEDRLKAIGQDIAKAQVVSALEKMGGGQDPSSIAGEMRSGGTNA